MPDRTSTRYRWYALGMLTLVFTSSHVDRQIMGILLEPIKADLQVTDGQMGLLIGITFALFYATLGMPIAWLADRSNRRNIVAASAAIWSVMTVLCGYAGSFLQLALARIGVGIGEAGSSPPSHSMIADLFPLATRTTALGVYAFGINIGLLIAYLGGGWLADTVGWRTTFVIVGAPGVLLAALVLLTVAEPRRGAQERAPTDTASQDPPPPAAFIDVVRHMWRTPTIFHGMLGTTLASFTGYGYVLWTPAFFVRSHDLSLTQTGLVMALFLGVVGGIGTLAAGRIADWLGARDPRWRIWVTGVAYLAGLPFLIAFFMVESLWLAMLCYVVPAFLGGWYLAPGFALVQNLTPASMRSLASSINLFVLNIIGLGTGPWLVGQVSDLLTPSYGTESLRHALVLLAFVNVWAAVHYALAGRTMTRDLERVEAL